MPRPQKYRDVAKFLRSVGWNMQRQGKGDHEIWGNGTDKIVIPHHKEISAGVIGQIIKQIPNTPHNWK